MHYLRISTHKQSSTSRPIQLTQTIVESSKDKLFPTSSLKIHLVTRYPNIPNQFTHTRIPHICRTAEDSASVRLQTRRKVGTHEWTFGEEQEHTTGHYAAETLQEEKKVCVPKLTS